MTLTQCHLLRVLPSRKDRWHAAAQVWRASTWWCCQGNLCTVLRSQKDDASCMLALLCWQCLLRL
eukprot:5736782-Amphidinium_carterae.1